MPSIMLYVSDIVYEYLYTISKEEKITVSKVAGKILSDIVSNNKK